MRKPFVTVIVPTYNNGALLRNLLASLEQQTYPVEKFELILVDNGSRDETNQVIVEFKRNTKLEFSYYYKNYRGPSASRNFALGIAKGEIIAFIDSDCVATPDWIEQGIASFDDQIGLVQGMTLPNPNASRYFLHRTVNVTKEGVCYETCNIFYRMEALRKVNFFSQEYEEFGYPFFGEDLDLAFKVKRAGYKTRFQEKALVYHHVFKLSLWQWLIEPRNTMTWPYLVRKFPETRRHLYKRYFLLKRTALFDLFIIGIVASGLSHWSFLVLTLPHLVYCIIDKGRGGAPNHPLIRLCKGVLTLPRMMVCFLVLLWGSIRFRRVVI